MTLLRKEREQDKQAIKLLQEQLVRLSFCSALDLLTLISDFSVNTPVRTPAKAKAAVQNSFVDYFSRFIFGGRTNKHHLS